MPNQLESESLTRSSPHDRVISVDTTQIVVSQLSRSRLSITFSVGTANPVFLKLYPTVGAGAGIYLSSANSPITFDYYNYPGLCQAEWWADSPSGAQNLYIVTVETPP